MGDLSASVNQTTLVKYDNPISVNVREQKKEKLKLSPSDSALHHDARSEIPRIPQGLAGVCQTIPLNKQDTEVILNAIVPPKEWNADGKVWRQTVSTVPATKSDVIGLQELLDRRLKEGNARETGICHTRRELYTQFFDELIRQVTINSAERGLLLLRVRNEIRRTFRAYEALYQSAMSYGIRKALMGEGKKELLDKSSLEEGNEIEELKKTVADLSLHLKVVNDRHVRKREALMKIRIAELARQKEINEQVKQQIWSAVFPKAVAQ